MTTRSIRMPLNMASRMSATADFLFDSSTPTKRRLLGCDAAAEEEEGGGGIAEES